MADFQGQQVNLPEGSMFFSSTVRHYSSNKNISQTKQHDRNVKKNDVKRTVLQTRNPPRDLADAWANHGSFWETGTNLVLPCFTTIWVCLKIGYIPNEIAI